MTRCYYCGKEANDSPDHVPPEVLFRGGSGQSFKTPEILTVPSCTTHNRDASSDDESFAWILSHSATGSNAATSVSQGLLLGIHDRAHSNPAFFDERFDLFGCRILRSADDYDSDGHPKTRFPDKASMLVRLGLNLQRRDLVDRVIARVAAGVYFHISGGRPLGLEHISRLVIRSPDMHWTEAEIFGQVPVVPEQEYFSSQLTGWRIPAWRSMASGSEQVFQVQVALDQSRPNRFGIKMLFYENIRYWVTLTD